MKDRKFLIAKGDKPKRCKVCGIAIRQENKSMLCNYCREGSRRPKKITGTYYE
jgi:hypothetical protein